MASGSAASGSGVHDSRLWRADLNMRLGAAPTAMPRVVHTTTVESPADQHVGGRVQPRLRGEPVAEESGGAPGQRRRGAGQITLERDLPAEPFLADLVIPEQLPAGEVRERATGATRFGALRRMPALALVPQV
jgi:hypothetical protein